MDRLMEKSYRPAELFLVPDLHVVFHPVIVVHHLLNLVIGSEGMAVVDDPRHISKWRHPFQAASHCNGPRSTDRIMHSTPAPKDISDLLRHSHSIGRARPSINGRVKVNVDDHTVRLPALTPSSPSDESAPSLKFSNEQQALHRPAIQHAGSDASYPGLPQFVNASCPSSTEELPSSSPIIYHARKRNKLRKPPPTSYQHANSNLTFIPDEPPSSSNFPFTFIPRSKSSPAASRSSFFGSIRSPPPLSPNTLHYPSSVSQRRLERSFSIPSVAASASGALPMTSTEFLSMDSHRIHSTIQRGKTMPTSRSSWIRWGKSKGRLPNLPHSEVMLPAPYLRGDTQEIYMAQDEPCLFPHISVTSIQGTDTPVNSNRKTGPVEAKSPAKKRLSSLSLRRWKSNSALNLLLASPTSLVSSPLEIGKEESDRLSKPLASRPSLYYPRKAATELTSPTVFSEMTFSSITSCDNLTTTHEPILLQCTGMVSPVDERQEMFLEENVIKHSQEPNSSIHRATASMDSTNDNDGIGTAGKNDKKRKLLFTIGDFDAAVKQDMGFAGMFPHESTTSPTSISESNDFLLSPPTAALTRGHSVVFASSGNGHSEGDSFERRRRWTLAMAHDDVTDEDFVGEVEKMRIMWDENYDGENAISDEPLSVDDSYDIFRSARSTLGHSGSSHGGHSDDHGGDSTWLQGLRALMTTRDLLRTEKRYLKSLQGLLVSCPHELPPEALGTFHELSWLGESLDEASLHLPWPSDPSPDVMIPLLVSLLKTSNDLLQKMVEDPSVWGVATAFLRAESAVESAFVPWCQSVGGWLVNDDDDRERKYIRDRSHSYGKATRRLSKTKFASGPPSPGQRTPHTSEPPAVPNKNNGLIPPVPAGAHFAPAGVTLSSNDVTVSPLKRSATAWRRSMPTLPTHNSQFDTPVIPSPTTSLFSSKRKEREYQAKVSSFRELGILPVQRVTRYSLLFTDLLKYTPVTSPSRALVERALEASTRIASKCNEAQQNPAFRIK